MFKEENYTKIDITRIAKGEKEKIPDTVAREFYAKIILNEEQIVTLKCSPDNYDYLGVGYLFTQGILQRKEDIDSIVIDADQAKVSIKTKNTDYVGKDFLLSQKPNVKIEKLTDRLLLKKNFLQVNDKIIFNLIKDIQKKAEIFRLTGGVHHCALAGEKGSIILFTEDISRYNTIDKILGEAFLKNISTEDKIIITSCRITSDILSKIAFGRIPVVISRAASTDKAIDFAQKTCITLIGFARDEKMNIYTHPERIII